ncbi:MAG: beta-ketoacyl synthase N-terminal-like domain-containing protein [Flavimaricola sp.]|nr:beta-ketoacyl synthase N-terminal-like domain-containing protein [Flavimaricola sp.]
MNRPDNSSIAVTGMGMVTSLGQGIAANWAAMLAGQSGAALVRRFATDGLRTRFAATVESICDPTLRPTDRTEHLAMLAMTEALAQSGHAAGPRFPGKLIVGVPPVQMEWPDRIDMASRCDDGDINDRALIRAAADQQMRPLFAKLRFGKTAEHLARHLRPLGMPVTISTACSSGASAIQIGVETIRRGDADAAIVIGADASVSPEMLLRFGLLSALSRRNETPETASRPFDKTRDGFVPGEGAAALVLERGTVAAQRGANILGYIRGVGERLDAYHRVRQRPDAGPVGEAMAAAIRDAGLEPDDIDYVSAHGTSTGDNDRVESLGLHHVFGQRTNKLPVSSIKSMIGHTMSAAGAIEAVASLLMMQHQTLLPTINFDTPDPDAPLDVVPNTARAAKAHHVLSNSFGFGGQNVCIVLSDTP